MPARLEASVDGSVVTDAALALLLVITSGLATSIYTATRTRTATALATSIPVPHHRPHMPCAIKVSVQLMSNAPGASHPSAQRHCAAVAYPGRRASILDCVPLIPLRCLPPRRPRVGLVLLTEGHLACAVAAGDGVVADVVTTFAQNPTVGAEPERELDEAVLPRSLPVVAAAPGVGGRGHGKNASSVSGHQQQGSQSKEQQSKDQQSKDQRAKHEARG